MHKEAIGPEWLSDFLWDDSAGPFENILRWADRLLIFSGGGKAVVLGGLYLLGIGFHDLGRKIDEHFELKTIGDIGEKITDPVKAGDDLAESMWPEIQKNLQKESSIKLSSIRKSAVGFTTVEAVESKKDQAAREKHERKMDLERQKTQRESLKTQREKMLGERQRGKQMAPLFQGIEKNVETEEKEKKDKELKEREKKETDKKEKERQRAKDKEHKRDRQHQKSMAKIRRGGKAAVAGGLLRGAKGKLALGAGLGLIISKVFQLLGGKTLLMKALRSAGIVGTEAIHKDEGDAKTPRERIKQNEKRELTPAEEVIEKILSR